MDSRYAEILLNILLQRKENSSEFVDELRSYLNDLSDGQLKDSDIDYLRALANRLNVNIPNFGQPLGNDQASKDVSFLDGVKVIAQTTEEKWRQELEEEDKERLLRLSAALQRFADDLEREVLGDARGDHFGLPSGEVRMRLERESGQPELFMRGNEEDLKTTDGYKKLHDKCQQLSLKLEFESDFEEVWEDQRALGFHRFAPTVYHVDVVVSGWK